MLPGGRSLGTLVLAALCTLTLVFAVLFVRTAVAYAAATAGVTGDLSLWDLVREGWREGGLAFIFFAGLVMFATGRVFTRRQYEEALTNWKARYEENDKRWKERFDERTRETEQLRTMLYQQMGWTNRVVTATERVAAAAVPSSPP